MASRRKRATWLLAGGDHDKYLLKKRKKKDFDYMTSSVLKEHQKHLLASINFKAVYTRLLFIPSIGITLVGGILAVLAQSGLYTEHTNTVFTISIAILASFSVFWQSLMKQLDYGGRASLHESAAYALTKIYKLATMRSREQSISDLDDIFNKRSNSSGELHDGLDHAEEGIPSTNQDGSNTPGQEGNVAPGMSAELQHVVDGEDHFTLSKQFEQALQGCTSVVPIKITAAFNALESRIDVCNKRLVPSKTAKPKIAWEKVYPALYHQMTLTIIGSKLWPYVAPGAEWAVDETIKNFQKLDARLLEVLVARGEEIDIQYKTMSTRTLFAQTTENTPLFSTDIGERE